MALPSRALEQKESTLAARAKVALFRSTVDFGRAVCGDLPASSEREWLVTNGIGGFASGTISCALTRRYHGLLFAALTPPVGRTLLVAKLDETASYLGDEYQLYCNRWSSGFVDSQSRDHIERFRLEGTTPVWSFALADALIEKRIWMQHGANTTFVRYDLVRGGEPIRLTLKALVNYRDYHNVTHAGDWKMRVDRFGTGLRVTAHDGATPFYLLCEAAQPVSEHAWYRNFELPQERARGLEDREDHLHAATFDVTLDPGANITIVVTTDPKAPLDGQVAYEIHQSREQRLLDVWGAAHPQAAVGAPEWIRQLVLAADQFIVTRPREDDPAALSVIAGYPWFADWGRDTMIALPGLTLTTGRPEIARKVLRSFARFVDQGMLPNNFPDREARPDYNSVDAALWFFEAVRQAADSGNRAEDEALLRDLYPVLADVIEWHLRGTRFQIHANADGLLYAGEPGVQLTWMDAKVGDWVVTPRTGKPVEINALWYNALATMLDFARKLGKPTASYEFLVRQVETSFQRFWNESEKCLFDVIDGPSGNDATLRPNQIFAVSVPHSPLSHDQQKAVVDKVGRELLTSHGLRSLVPGHVDYKGHYGGPPRDRDAAYHQGTVWSWLLGAFALAHLRVHGDKKIAASYLEPIAQHVKTACLGSISEIFDADAPFFPRGCIAQAWSVAEVLRAWHACNDR
jgi:predicted glycogen debranching enzyme